MGSVFAAVAVLGLAGCGGSTPQHVIVRVANSTITASTLEHWMSVTAPRQAMPQPPRFTACISHLQESSLYPSSQAQLKRACVHEYGELRQSALHSLIVGQWLIGEAAQEGKRVTDREIARRFDERYSSPEGLLELKELTTTGGQTTADLRLELQWELASTRLRQRLEAYSLEVPASQIESYYNHHVHQFFLPQRRNVDVIGNVAESAKIRTVFSQLRRGASFASMSYHESLERVSFMTLAREKRVFYEAVFRSRPNVVVGPLRINGFYFLFEVVGITPARTQDLGEARSTIVKQLGVKRRESFVERWRRKWIAQTSCAAGYVVQKCRQAHIAVAAAAPEDPVELN